MKLRHFVFGLTVGIVQVAMHSANVEACGGCFVQQTENTQVSGHRMVLSISPQQTTLWDQISYSGDPTEFAWVLPIRGQVSVGLSSDALFEELDYATQVVVRSPSLSCPTPAGCNGGFGTAAAATSGGAGGGVTVIAQAVVGPYETVQLASSDPQALNDWLGAHGYDIPTDVKPVINGYVSEGFDFLALRLLPGQGISAMRPVRVTAAGASTSLPLRMVAAGTGAVTPITLWVVGEGRYAPSNMPSFTIDSSQLVWDWNTQSSNYSVLRQAGFDASSGKAWLIEGSHPQGMYVFQQLIDEAGYDPTGSGYADDMGLHAQENATQDIQAVVGGNAPNQLWVTRLSAELTRPALATDLAIGASPEQSEVQNSFQVSQTIGTAPACPPVQSCGGQVSSTGALGSLYGSGGSGGSAGSVSGNGCTVSSSGAGGGFTMLALGAVAATAVGLGARRRKGPGGKASD